MKRQITLSAMALLLVASLGFSQSQRFVILEQFTQASCGPCAGANPHIDQVVEDNADKMTCIKYQVSWPGYDPMYLDNPEDVNVRKNLYSVNSVPFSAMDGSYYTGNYSGVNNNSVNTRYNMPSPFDLFIYNDIDTENDIVKITVMAKATQAVSGNLVAHTAVIEKNIHFNSPPGSNGERDFSNVMKKLLPNKSGTSLPDFEVGDYVIFETEWDWSTWNVYDEAELAVLGFIQDMDSKEMHQAANASDAMFAAPYTLDAQVLSVDNILDSYCEDVMAPKVTIRNNGSEDLTSLNIEYSVNGGDTQTYSWTGNLSFLETAVVELPEFDITLQTEDNELVVLAVSPNGSDDDYAKNNTLIHAFDHAAVTEDYVNLILRTDNNPEETTWEITDYEGNVLQSGGPYTEASQFININVDFTDSDCLLFTIYDAGGNGMCCENGNGLFGLKTNDGTTFASGGVFKDADYASFEMQVGVGFTEITPVENVKVFPNPVMDLANVSFELKQASQVELHMFNSLGEEVYTMNNNLAAGSHNQSIQTSNLPEGIYFIQLQVNENVETHKLSVIR